MDSHAGWQIRASVLGLTALAGLAVLAPLVAQASPHSTAQKKSATVPKEDQMLLQADAVTYDGEDRVVSAVGHVEISDQGRTLLADRVDYDEPSDKVTARGHVSIIDLRGNVAFADHVMLTDHMRDGVLSGFGSLIGKNGRLASLDAQHIGGTIVVARHAIYSPCKICNRPGQRTPLWQVKAEKIIYDQVKHKVNFVDAVIAVGGMPLAWMPAFWVNDPTVRHASGLLMPTLGTSSILGYYVRLPVYLNFSPSQDMTIAPTVSTSGGDVMEVEYRARGNDGGLWLQGSGAYNPQGGLGGTPGSQTYGHLFGSGRLSLADDWRTGFDIQMTSNPAYMRSYDISFLDRLTNDLFLEDTPGRSRFALSSDYFQGLRSSDVTARIPYVLPKLEFSYIPVKKVAGGTFRFDLSGVAIGRDSGRDDQRLTAEINWKEPFIAGNGQVWTFSLDARGDEYRFENDANGPIQANAYWLDRGTAYAALDWRWPFVANGTAGHSYVVQPIAQLIVQPYGGNPAGLRIEDANDFEFDDNNVFSINQVPGYDLIESGPRANVGVMAEALFPGGEVEGKLGQTYRLKPDPVLALFSASSGSSSDIVGSVSVKFPHLDITDRIDMDQGNGAIRQQEIYVIGSYDRSSLQLSYIQLPQSAPSLGLPAQKEINAQADLNIWNNWQIFAAAQRDLDASQFLNTELGVGYEDECLAISLAYRRKYAEDLSLGITPSSSVILRFNLKTGDSPIEPFSLFPKDVFALTHP